MHNRLTSLAKFQADIIEKRTVQNSDHPYPKVIDVMAECLDLQELDDHYNDESFDLSSFGKSAFKKLCKIAGLSSNQIEVAQKEYEVFKSRVVDIIKNEINDFRNKFEHILFKVHQSKKDCQVKVKKDCIIYNKVNQPLKIMKMKVLHLFLKEETLYTDIEVF